MPENTVSVIIRDGMTEVYADGLAQLKACATALYETQFMYLETVSPAATALGDFARAHLRDLEAHLAREASWLGGIVDLLTQPPQS